MRTFKTQNRLSPTGPLVNGSYTHVDGRDIIDDLFKVDKTKWKTVMNRRLAGERRAGVPLEVLVKRVAHHYRKRMEQSTKRIAIPVFPVTNENSTAAQFRAMLAKELGPSWGGEHRHIMENAMDRSTGFFFIEIDNVRDYA